MSKINVYLLPSLLQADALEGETAVVIDVLRATTTITQALAAGARSILPCEHIEEARELAAAMPGSLLGGERQGLAIEGFDLGNSPAEYQAEHVSGRTIVFTTTNGTRAIHACRRAKRTYLAAFTNLSPVVDRIATDSSIHIVCAGTNGEVTREDALLAGAMVDQLTGRDTGSRVLNDQAELTLDAWRSSVRDLTSSRLLAEQMRSSRGGRNLLEIGRGSDIDLAAVIDQLNLVPESKTIADRLEIVPAT